MGQDDYTGSTIAPVMGVDWKINRFRVDPRPLGNSSPDRGVDSRNCPASANPSETAFEEVCPD